MWEELGLDPDPLVPLDIVLYTRPWLLRSEELLTVSPEVGNVKVEGMFKDLLFRQLFEEKKL